MTWVKDIPEWMQTAVIAPAVVGVGWLFKKWWAMREAREAARAAREQAYVAEIKALQQEVKELLQDRIRYEMVRRESSDQTMVVLRELLALAKAGKGAP